MGIGGFNEPASMFNLMSTIFPIFIVLFIAVFIFVIIKGIMQWNYNKTFQGTRFYEFERYHVR